MVSESKENNALNRNISVLLLKTAYGKKYSVRDQFREMFPDHHIVCVLDSNYDILIIRFEIKSLASLRDGFLKRVFKVEGVTDSTCYIGTLLSGDTKRAGWDYTNHIFIRSIDNDHKNLLKVLNDFSKDSENVLLTARLTGDYDALIITKINGEDWESLFSINQNLGNGKFFMKQVPCP